MHLSPEKTGPCGRYCDGSCGDHRCDFRPSASQESGPRSVTAPRPVKARRGTSNRLEWLQISLFLAGHKVKP